MDSMSAIPAEAALALAASGFIPAAEVLTELLASPLPREGRALMTALSTETLIGNPPAWPFTWSPFRCEFGFHEWTGSLAAFPDWGGNAEFKTHAVGVWQDEPATYAGIAARTGNAGFEPQDQIVNNWALAVRDYGTRTGGNLLDDLVAGDAAHLDAVQKGLVGTWPGGANSGFPARYTAALALFPIDAPAPPPPAEGLQIPLGQQCTVPILSATDATGAPVTAIPADLLVPDDPSICSAAIFGSSLMIKTLAIGSTTLRGADQAKVITVARAVAPPAVAHLVLDWEHPVFSPMAAVKAMAARLPMLAMAGALLMLGATSAGPPEPEKLLVAAAPMFIFPPAKEAAKMNMLCPARDLRWLLSPSPCVSLR